MVVRYDSLNRLEKPKLTLCNPGSEYKSGVLTNVVGVLTDHEAEEIVFNFNATSELNFRINRLHDYRKTLTDDSNIDEYKEIDSLYKAVKNRRLVFVETIGFFMITNITEGYDGHNHYKDVNAQSIDIELQQKMIPFIDDGTYIFETDTSQINKGILNMIAEVVPMWTIGHVDESVANRWRTFEDVDTSLNCLSFLLENAQDAYECIILFDPINRVINVYDQANYVIESGIHITEDDVIDSLDIRESADDIYTAITALGGEDITISPVNPIGSNTIYDFTYYFDWMSDELRTKVINWQQDVAEAEDRYLLASRNYYETMEAASDVQMEIERLTTQVTLYRRMLENVVAESSALALEQYNAAIVASGGEPVSISAQVSVLKAEIQAKISEKGTAIQSNSTELDKLLDRQKSYKDKVDEIVSALSFDNYFTDTVVENGEVVTRSYVDELQNYIYEGSYTDEYVVITDVMGYAEKFEQMKTLYERAKEQLKKVSQPTQEFSIDVENFVFAKEFEHWSGNLETGCLISVELDVNDIANLFLSNMTINYDDHSLSMTFGNRYNKFDPKSLFEDVLGSVSRSANSLNYVKDVIYPIKSGELTEMQVALQNSRDITMRGALASTGEEVVIDGSGYTGKQIMDNGEADPRQIKITGRNIVFTDDSWESSKIAIGELILDNGDGTNESVYGVNAENIYGDMIIGGGLNIVSQNDDGTTTALFDVVDGMIDSKVTDVETEINGELNAVTQSVSEIKQQADSIDLLIDTFVTVTEVDGKEIGEVNTVRTTTGYEFGANGLIISQSGNTIQNKIDNTGMYVQSKTIDSQGNESTENVLVANDEGVNAINLKSRMYLIIGDNSRFENYVGQNYKNTGSPENRTACYFIGTPGTVDPS